MVCPKCGNSSVTVTSEMVGGKTKKKRMGLLWRLGRMILMICTLGLWGIFGKKSGTEKTTYKNKTVAICQSCGYKWDV